MATAPIAAAAGLASCHSRHSALIASALIASALIASALIASALIASLMLRLRCHHHAGLEEPVCVRSARPKPTATMGSLGL